MTKQEAGQLLAILKAAYPMAYKDMSQQELLGVVNVWQSQFKDIDAKLVLIALHKCIKKCKFVPTIAEVNEVINNLYWDAYSKLELVRLGHKKLSEEEIKELNFICDELNPYKDLENELLEEQNIKALR